MVGPPMLQPIFALPFCVQRLEELARHNAELQDELRRRAVLARSAQHGYQSPDDLTEQSSEPLGPAVAALAEGLRSVVGAISNLDALAMASLRLEKRCWFSVVERYGAIASQAFPMTAWCAVYCVAAPEPSAERFDSGVLRLHETRPGTMFPDATNTQLPGPYASGHCTWRPVAGDMAVFPGFLTHEVALVHGTGSLMLLMMRARFVAPGQSGVGRW